MNHLCSPTAHGLWRYRQHGCRCVICCTAAKTDLARLKSKKPAKAKPRRATLAHLSRIELEKLFRLADPECEECNGLGYTFDMRLGLNGYRIACRCTVRGERRARDVTVYAWKRTPVADPE